MKSGEMCNHQIKGGQSHSWHFRQSRAKQRVISPQKLLKASEFAFGLFLTNTKSGEMRFKLILHS
jgi:hypothetical protein